MSTHLLLDPDGSKRAAMAASLEYGTHPIVGQHTYRTIPTCQGLVGGKPCGRTGPLFQGLCHRCTAADERGHQ